MPAFILLVGLVTVSARTWDEDQKYYWIRCRQYHQQYNVPAIKETRQYLDQRLKELEDKKQYYNTHQKSADIHINEIYDVYDKLKERKEFEENQTEDRRRLSPGTEFKDYESQLPSKIRSIFQQEIKERPNTDLTSVMKLVIERAKGKKETSYSVLGWSKNGEEVFVMSKNYLDASDIFGASSYHNWSGRCDIKETFSYGRAEAWRSLDFKLGDNVIMQSQKEESGKICGFPGLERTSQTATGYDNLRMEVCFGESRKTISVRNTMAQNVPNAVKKWILNGVGDYGGGSEDVSPVLLEKHWQRMKGELQRKEGALENKNHQLDLAERDGQAWKISFIVLVGLLLVVIIGLRLDRGEPLLCCCCEEEDHPSF